MVNKHKEAQVKDNVITCKREGCRCLQRGLQILSVNNYFCRRAKVFTLGQNLAFTVEKNRRSRFVKFGVHGRQKYAPPYIDRHVDYFNSWDESHEIELFDDLKNAHCDFILSTWHHNDYRKNEYIESHWNQFNILTREHFYHVGGNEKNRNPMMEAIVTTIDTSLYEYPEAPKQEQLTLLEPKLHYKSA